MSLYELIADKVERGMVKTSTLFSATRDRKLRASTSTRDAAHKRRSNLMISCS